MYCFFCIVCQDEKEEKDCRLIDIIDTISGRMYMFECPDCGLIQEGFLSLDVGENNAVTKTK